MSKYELECGHRPLKPWQRALAYSGFIVVVALAYIRVRPEMPAKMAMVFIAALIISFVGALFAYWDARIAAHHKRRHACRTTAITRGFAPAPFTFFKEGQEWDYLNDSAPTTSRLR